MGGGGHCRLLHCGSVSLSSLKANARVSELTRTEKWRRRRSAPDINIPDVLPTKNNTIIEDVATPLQLRRQLPKRSSRRLASETISRRIRVLSSSSMVSATSAMGE